MFFLAVKVMPHSHACLASLFLPDRCSYLLLAYFGRTSGLMALIKDGDAHISILNYLPDFAFFLLAEIFPHIALV